MYWNYFYNVWKTVSSSPFSNAIVFVTTAASTTLPDSFTVEVTDKSHTEDAITLTLTPQFENPALAHTVVNFEQTEGLTQNGIAMHKYGALLIPASQFATNIVVQANIDGVEYSAGENNITSAANVGDTVTLTKVQA